MRSNRFDMLRIVRMSSISMFIQRWQKSHKNWTQLLSKNAIVIHDYEIPRCYCLLWKTMWSASAANCSRFFSALALTNVLVFCCRCFCRCHGRLSVGVVVIFQCILCSTVVCFRCFVMLLPCVMLYVHSFIDSNTHSHTLTFAGSHICASVLSLSLSFSFYRHRSFLLSLYSVSLVMVMLMAMAWQMALEWIYRVCIFYC